MKANTEEMALYLFLFGETFDKEVYDDLEEAVDNEIGTRFGEYQADGGSYKVYNGEDEAIDAAVESLNDLFDDIGVFGLSNMATSWAIDNALESAWFEEARDEDNDNYASDIRTENSSDSDLYLNRLHEEMVEAGIMDEMDEDSDEQKIDSEIDENLEKFFEYRNSDYNSAIEWFKEYFGEEELSSVAKRNNLVDTDAVAHFIIDTDGLGPVLSGYDGNEYEQDGYLIFRAN